MFAARFISFWTGFCSLSFEIAWVRLYGYANESTPQAFGFVLAVYLLGIALGAQYGKRICRLHNRRGIERRSVMLLGASAVVAVLAPWLYTLSVSISLDGLVTPLAILATAASFSILFPITHHLGTPETKDGPKKKGQHFSQVYMLNVLGAALGPLFTGYVLLDWFTLNQVFAFLACVAVVTAVGAAILFGFRIDKVVVVTLVGATSVPLVVGVQSLSDPHAFAREFSSFGTKKFHTVLENRHGIITISKEDVLMSGRPPFVDFGVYGGNVYDGRVNVDLERNTNALHRPLVMHALQPKATRALVLGLSIGSWLTVIEGFPGLSDIDVIEINSGYLGLAESFGPQARALKDPRVSVYVDDARRWLQYHPNVRYDLIIMNTTWHWRANSSMLLSREMLQLIQRHLAPEGVVTFNATGSTDAFFTAAQVFSHVRRYENFIYAADWDFSAKMEDSRSWEALRLVTIDGKPAFSGGSKQLARFAAIPFVPLEPDLKSMKRPAEVITDDNMLVEYKWGRKY